MVQIDNPFAWLFIHMLAYFEYVMMGGFLVFMTYLYVAMTRDQRRYEEREKMACKTGVEVVATVSRDKRRTTLD